jgi:hypothetical protein
MEATEADVATVSGWTRDKLETEYWWLRRELRNRLPTEGPWDLVIYVAPLALGVAAFVAGPESVFAFYSAGAAALVVATWGLLHRFLPFSWQGGVLVAYMLGAVGVAAGVGLGLLLGHL